MDRPLLEPSGVVLGADDLESACRHAARAGAVLAEHQPQDDVRVHPDPDGHPCCLVVRG